MSAAGKSVLPVAKWCATVRTFTDVFADYLRELQAHVCLVDHKYVVRISKDKVVSGDTEVPDPLCCQLPT